MGVKGTKHTRQKLPWSPEKAFFQGEPFYFIRIQQYGANYLLRSLQSSWTNISGSQGSLNHLMDSYFQNEVGREDLDVVLITHEHISNRQFCFKLSLLINIQFRLHLLQICVTFMSVQFLIWSVCRRLLEYERGFLTCQKMRFTASFPKESREGESNDFAFLTCKYLVKRKS